MFIKLELRVNTNFVMLVLEYMANLRDETKVIDKTR